MVARLGATPVPWWQPVAGLLALGVFAYLFVMLAARLFRAENLLSSRALSWKRLVEELRPQSAGQAAEPIRAAEVPARGSSINTGRWRTGQVASGNRFLSSVVGAAILLIVGVIEIARGESLGIVILVAGIALGALAYRRKF
jgi:hypothetical protein